MSRFRVELLKRAFLRGPRSFLQQAASLSLSIGPWRYLFVYKRDCTDLFRLEAHFNIPITFRNFRTWDSIDGWLQQVIEDMEKEHPMQIREMMARGWRLWLGLHDKKIAIYTWTRTADQSSDFLFPLSTSAVLIWHAETMASYRSIGLLSVNHDNIVRELGKEGIEIAFGTCATFNYASIRGLATASFQRIGTGILDARSGRGIAYFPDR